MSDMKTDKRYIKILGYLISIIFLYLTFKDAKLASVLTYLNNVNTYYLLGALMLEILYFAIRGLYQINNLYFIKRDIPFLISFSSIGIAQFYNVIFPARLGEVVRAFFLSKKQGVKKASVLSYIFIEKVLDMLIILLLLLLIICLRTETIELKNALTFFSGIILLIIFCLIIYFQFNQNLLLLVEKIVPKSMQDLIYKLNLEVLEGLKFYRTTDQVIRSICLLFVSWGIMLGVFWLVSYPYVKILGLPFYSCLVFMIFSALSLSVPSAPAGIGVMHYGLFLAVKILGGNIVDSQINVVAAFVISMHFFLMLLDILTGGGIMIYAKLMGKEKNIVYREALSND